MQNQCILCIIFRNLSALHQSLCRAFSIFHISNCNSMAIPISCSNYFCRFLTYSALFLLTQVINAQSATPEDSNEYWEAGSAAIDITPEGPLWMAGYASRVGPATEKIHSLWAKALVLRDHEGRTGVMISSDLVGIPRNISNTIRLKALSSSKLYFKWSS